MSSLDEICLLRSYDVAKAANKTYGQHMGAAAVEGGATGAVGFWGIPTNFALSMLVYFRAVQSVAMMYGYDVKEDPDELMIAGQVFPHPCPQAPMVLRRMTTWARSFSLPGSQASSRLPRRAGPP